MPKLNLFSPALSPALLILIYFVLSVIKLDYPGLQYDEVLFGNAALGMLDDSFIHKKIFGVPIMLMPYIGALKAYFYYFIFLIFDPSYMSIRLPMILLSGLSLWLIYSYTSRAAGFAVGILSLLFLVADANFISLIRTDVGPVALGLFFRCLALYYFFKFIENRRGIYLVAICLALLLGFFDKLNFVWFIVAFTFAALFFYGSLFGGVTEFFKRKRAVVIVGALTVSFLVPAIFAFRLGLTDELSLVPSDGHLEVVYNYSLGLANGSAFYEYLIGDWTGWRVLEWLVWLIIAVGTLLMFRQPKSRAKTFHFFNLVILALIFAQILATNKADAPWHIFMLHPMLAILLASSLAVVGKIVFGQNKSVRCGVTAAAAGLIFAAQFATYTVYISAYKKPYRNTMWSKEFDDLSAFSQSVSNKIVSLDWGFHNQLLTLARRRDKYYELSGVFNEPLTASQLSWLKNDFLNPDNNYLFLLHGENDTVLKPARRRFFETAENLGLRAELIKTFDETGKSLYEVYQVKAK